ncbi:MAG: circularly permuted type 2 ATP-grasp protein [Planctomycetota bacterium]
MQLLPYPKTPGYDELIDAAGLPRPSAAMLSQRIEQMGTEELQTRQNAAEAALFEAGATFSVYGDGETNERIIPFDIIPRIITGSQWDDLEAGLTQRITALNLFVADVYADRKIIQDGVIPEQFVELNQPTWKACQGITPPRGVYCHISGIDLVRDGNGDFRVLEDNLRCPSGVSYVLENRRVLKQTLPRVFDQLNIRSVDDYPEQLLTTLQAMAPDAIDRPRVVVLTPGIYNSAYFEHAYLAQQMGVPLVQNSDLVVHDGYVQMRTTAGLARVDVIYRRIDDAFLDPNTFRKDSMLGVPGIMEVYAAGRVALANAPGTGIADNKVIYAFVPDMIRYYLKEEPTLLNVDTFLCHRDTDRQHVLQNLHHLVVKPAHEAGGKGIVIGPHATKAELDKCAADIQADPDNFIAQPVLQLSTTPTICGDDIAPRHVDLRPYILMRPGKVHIIPGGLTRVALREGSLIVNSSQGGGTKDSWVVDAAHAATPTHNDSATPSDAATQSQTQILSQSPGPRLDNADSHDTPETHP